MNPKLRSLLARLTLVGGGALVVSLLARSAPTEQTLAIALESRQISRIDGVVTREGDREPTAGFSQDFAGKSPRVVRHRFSAPSGTYIVVITVRDRPSGENHDVGGAERQPGERRPIPDETSFERRVSLAGGEVIVSPE